MAGIRVEGDREVLETLIGEPLSAVTFVMDYVQLQFSSSRIINAVTLPVVHAGNRTFSSEQPGYRDALCERIGRTVKEAYAKADERLQIDFDDGSSVRISLKAEDRVAAESAIYQDHLTPEWASW